MIVTAATDSEAGPRGTTAFMAEGDSPGFRGALGELFFEDCEVHVRNVLGEEGRGCANALRVLANGRVGLAASNLGWCMKLLEMGMEQATTCEQCGAPIFEQQAMQHYLAEMALETLRSTAYRGVWMRTRV